MCTGILVDQSPNIQVISIDLMNENFIIPQTKRMVLNRAFHEGPTAYISINGQNVFQATNLALPIFLNSGDLISYSGNASDVSAFGYLVDDATLLIVEEEIIHYLQV